MPPQAGTPSPHPPPPAPPPGAPPPPPRPRRPDRARRRDQLSESVAIGCVAAHVELLAIGPADARVDDKRPIGASGRDRVVVDDDRHGGSDALLAAQVAAPPAR